MTDPYLAWCEERRDYEERKNEMDAVEFLKRTGEGGRIVSSGDLIEWQIVEARAQNRFFVDYQTGLGWALLPWGLTTDKDRDREAMLRGRP